MHYVYGKNNLTNINELIGNYLNNIYHDDDNLPKEKYYLSTIDYKKENDEFGNNKIINLRRIADIGRRFDIYETPQSKINFIWSCLCCNYSSKDHDLFNKFLNYFYSYNFTIRFLDIRLSDETIVNEKYNENSFSFYRKYNVLGKIDDNELLPDNIKNKYMIGEYNYGYSPNKELKIIINNPTLFWNLIFGDSKIYTGSDEYDSFSDLDFSAYKYKLVGGSDYSSCNDTNIFKSRIIEPIGTYQNGNYITKIYKDGTRTRELFPTNVFYDQCIFKKDLFKFNEIDIMQPEFPESIDLKITDRCYNSCKYCYAKSNKNGKHADLNFVKHIIDGMRPYTEIAIGGGNALLYPNLDEILEYAKTKNIICNITLKDIDLYNNLGYVNELSDKGLIKSVGISPTNIKMMKNIFSSYYTNCRFDYVVHLILGIQGKKFLNELKNQYINKILFLGYKNIGKGSSYLKTNNNTIENKINEIKNMNIIDLYKYADIISFDNLAIEQLKLDIKDKYNELYQGDDGKFSFYIDAVEQKFAKNSMSEKMYQAYIYESVEDYFYELKGE